MHVIILISPLVGFITTAEQKPNSLSTVVTAVIQVIDVLKLFM